MCNHHQPHFPINILSVPLNYRNRYLNPLRTFQTVDIIAALFRNAFFCQTTGAICCSLSWERIWMSCSVIDKSINSYE